jgi:hypothetical protein
MVIDRVIELENLRFLAPRLQDKIAGHRLKTTFHASTNTPCHKLRYGEQETVSASLAIWMTGGRAVEGPPAAGHPLALRPA